MGNVIVKGAWTSVETTIYILLTVYGTLFFKELCWGVRKLILVNMKAHEWDTGFFEFWKGHLAFTTSESEKDLQPNCIWNSSTVLSRPSFVLKNHVSEYRHAMRQILLKENYSRLNTEQTNINNVLLLDIFSVKFK